MAQGAIIACIAALIIMGISGAVLAMGLTGWGGGILPFRKSAFILLFSIMGLAALFFSIFGIIAGIATSNRAAFFFPSIIACFMFFWLLNSSINYDPIYRQIRLVFFGINMEPFFPSNLYFAAVTYMNFIPFILNLIFAVSMITMLCLLLKHMSKTVRSFAIINVVIWSISILILFLFKLTGSLYGFYSYGTHMLGNICCSAVLILWLTSRKTPVADN